MGSSQIGAQNRSPTLAGSLYHWATREAHHLSIPNQKCCFLPKVFPEYSGWKEISCLLIAIETRFYLLISQHDTHLTQSPWTLQLLTRFSSNRKKIINWGEHFLWTIWGTVSWAAVLILNQIKLNSQKKKRFGHKREWFVSFKKICKEDKHYILPLIAFENLHHWSLTIPHSKGGNFHMWCLWWGVK